MFLPNIRDCGIYVGTHPELCPTRTCFSHDLLILKAIQIHGHACPQVASSSIEVQRRVAQHIHHDVDALLLSQLRHDGTLPHLAKEIACLPIGVLALHPLIEISVWRLSNRRDTAAMRNEDIAARPAQ